MSQSNGVALRREILSSKLLNVKYLTLSDVKYLAAPNVTVTPGTDEA